jgi:DNA-binding CsgD family transcriptional regulator
MREINMTLIPKAIYKSIDKIHNKPYQLKGLQELNIPAYAEKIYRETAPAGLSWKDENGKYMGCCLSLSRMYDDSVQNMQGKTELEQKSILPDSARALFNSEDLHVFQTNKKYIAFASFHYADAHRHVCYTKEKFFDEAQQKSFVLVTGIELPQYIMNFLIHSAPQDLYKSRPQLENFNGLHFSNINLTSMQNGITLSEREEECLFLILRGHSAKSIANILNISERTAEFHTDNLKNKLDCHRKTHLLKTAIDLGYLTLIPDRFMKSSFL